MRDRYLVVRVTAGEREALHAVAARDDLSGAQVVREAIRREIQRRDAERSAARCQRRQQRPDERVTGRRRGEAEVRT